MGRVADFFREQSITLDGQKKAKMLSLDGEFEEMKAEIERLNTKVLKLEAKVSPLEKEVERYKKQLEQQKSGDLHLSETEVNILSFLCREPRDVSLTTIARNLGLTPIRADVFLRKLEGRGLVHRILDMSGGPPDFTLTADGKAYAVEQGWDQ